MKKLFLAVAAVAAFGSPLASTTLGSDSAAVKTRANNTAAEASTSSIKPMLRTVSTSEHSVASLVDTSASVAGTSTYVVMFLGLGLIGLSLRSRRDIR